MKWIVMIACLGLAACGTWKSNGETMVESELRVSNYNDLVDEYRIRPTFVSLRERVGAPPMLQISVDRYGPESGDLWLTKEAAEELIVQVEKYFQWADIAESRGDQVDKKIGDVRSAGGFRYATSFFSANSKDHLFVVASCSLGCSVRSDERHYFDKENAKRLQRLLREFASGDLKPLNQDAVYR